MHLPRLSLRVKLLAALLSLVVMCALIAVLAIAKLGSVRDSGDALYADAYVPAAAAGDANAAARDLNLQSVKMEAIVIAKAGASLDADGIPGRVPVSYRGVASSIATHDGEAATYPSFKDPADIDGLFGGGTKYGLRHVTDGTSNTIVFV